MACGTVSREDAARLSTLNLQAPAKINLFLAITGRRTDSFHDLLSVAAPLLWGDMLAVTPRDTGFTLSCDNPGIPADDSNLVIKAARAFAAATGWTGGAHFELKKKIPAGSGLGGASSDATAALKGLNQLAGEPLDEAGLARVAASVGSDCVLFLSGMPVVMRGRGERIEPLPKEPYSRIRGMRILVFKPGFSILTPWAFARLVADAPRGYVTPGRAEARLADWLDHSGSSGDNLLFNSMERPAFAKYPALPAMIEHLQNRFGVAARMSGSGSACFALLHEDMAAAQIESAIREAWGPSAFVMESRIA
jgi:4-diphosphocytidyl-2-C-methyl-D-erythritol kinase